MIAAVVLGGTSIFGGEGSYVGTALGGLFLYLIGPAMLYAGVNKYWRTAKGGAILAVISLDCEFPKTQKARGAEMTDHADLYLCPIVTCGT